MMVMKMMIMMMIKLQMIMKQIKHQIKLMKCFINDYMFNIMKKKKLDICTRTEIHKHFDTYKDYKLPDREIN